MAVRSVVISIPAAERAVPRLTYMKETFEAIIKDPRYEMGITYGTPREGHQEGSVKNHIADLEKNLEKLRPLLKTEDEYWKLKILIHVHDSCKYWATRNAPILDPNSHASLAAKFLSEFTGDQDLITMTQFHDEGYGLYRRYEKKGICGVPESRFIGQVKDLELFLFFVILDGYTPSKDPKKLRWVVDEVNKLRPVPRVCEAMGVFGL